MQMAAFAAILPDSCQLRMTALSTNPTVAGNRRPASMGLQESSVSKLQTFTPKTPMTLDATVESAI